MSNPSKHELMLTDTISELLAELGSAPRDDVFDRGYRQGMARALDVIKQQTVAFGLGDADISRFDYAEWIG